MLLRRHRPDNEALSALLDGQLAGGELDAARAHVASCATCRDRLAALRRTRDALRSLPEVDAPRSFRLRAADVAAPAPVRRTPVAMRAMPVLGAAAALVFIVVLEADLARGGSSTGNQATGLQAFSAATRGPVPGAAVGQIGGADSAAGPTTAGNDARSSSSGNSAVAPPATAFDSSSGGAGAPSTEGETPPVPAQAPGGPEAAGSPQPALGLAPEQATPGGGQAAPNAPAPAVPSTQAEQPSLPKSAVTQPQPTPADARQVLGAPTSSSSNSSADRSSGGGSSGSSDAAYRIVEALAGAIALAAAASFVVWRIRNRKVVP